MLLIYLDEQALSEGERERCYRESTQLAHELSAAGQYLAAAPLEPTAAATSVRVRQGKRVVTDGPFAETKEQLGGYFLIDASDLDEAITIAARIPANDAGHVVCTNFVPSKRSIARGLTMYTPSINRLSRATSVQS